MLVNGVEKIVCWSLVMFECKHFHNFMPIRQYNSCSVWSCYTWSFWVSFKTETGQVATSAQGHKSGEQRVGSN